MTFITIATSIKGTATWLPQMLSSLEAQAGYPQDVELIIRINGREDFAPAESVLATSLLPLGTKVIWNEKCDTLSDSMNAIADMATSEYIMRLDPDDKLYPETLDYVRFFSKNMGQQFRDVTCFHGGFVDMDPRRKVSAFPVSAQVLWEMSPGAYNFIAPTELVRRVRWKEVGYEDWNMYIRLMSHGAFFIMLERPSLIHRVRPDGRGIKFAMTHSQRLYEMRKDNIEWFNLFGLNLE